MYAPILKGWDFEDVCQVLRVKIWKALLAFEPDRYPRGRLGKARDSFIFGCVRNAVKDLVKRQREQALFIEDVAPSPSVTHQVGGRTAGHESGPRDAFELRYLSAPSEESFGSIDEGHLVLPNTLTSDERRVLLHMYIGFSQTETAEELGIDRQKVISIVRLIRRKMADWRPSAPQAAAHGPARVPVAA